MSHDASELARTGNGAGDEQRHPPPDLWSLAGHRLPEAFGTRLAAIVVAAAEVLGVDSVGAMLIDADGRLRLVAASDDAARILERAQLELCEGPGIDATRSGDNVAVDDLASTSRWSSLVERLRPMDAGAVLSSPIRVHGAVVGNLNAIARGVHTWTPAERRASDAYAGVIGALLEVAAPSDPSQSVCEPGPLRQTGRLADSSHVEEQGHADRP